MVVTSKRLRQWRRTAVAGAVGMCLASLVFAQQSAGSITGRAGKGDSVAVEASSIGVSRQLSLSSDGTFQVNQLPPGTYKVTLTKSNGAKSTTEVVVSAGESAFASFPDEQRVVVTGSAIRSLDVKSTESSMFLSKAQIDRIPVVRDVTAITLLAPGATFGDARIGQTPSARAGNVPSLGGASPAENAYYIDGFNVTNMVNGVAYNQVPYEGVASQQVLIGGYSAMYGRSLGGVVSVTTKRGENEWHGGANITLTPKDFAGGSVRTEQVPGGSAWSLTDRPGGTNSTVANVWAGGPVIQDRLYVFGLLQGAKIKSDTYGISTQFEESQSSPQYLARVDWNLTKDNLLSLTAFSDKNKVKRLTWDQVSEYGVEKDAFKGPSSETTGGQNTILKWTSFVTQDFTLSALAGVGKYDRSSESAGADCPFVRDERTGTVIPKGCYLTANITAPGANDKRTAYRLDAEWVLGKHTLKFGMDRETYAVVDGTTRSGGIGYQVKVLQPDQSLPNGFKNDTAAPIEYVQEREFSNGGTFKTENSAWYLEDAFQITDRVLATVGLRSESFNNKNGAGSTFIKVNNTLAPRLGLAWDLNGDAKTKLFANAGRYYIPVATNTNVRLSGAETDIQNFYVFGGFGTDRTEKPILGTKLGGTLPVHVGDTPDPRTVVDPNIKPLFQDEFIIGMQKALSDRWSVGLKYTNRKLKSAMDDICAGNVAFQWAQTQSKYTPAQALAIGRAVGNCFLYNPGKDLTANVDLGETDTAGNSVLTSVRIPAAALRMPEPQRTYDALEFSFERAWDKKWSVGGSYVLAYSKGNTEGYVKSDIGQDDAGISQDFDFPGLMFGSTGFLPNDRRHTLKVWGSYAATDEWRVGGSMISQSGRPKNCFGVYPTAALGSAALDAPIPGSFPTSSAAYGDASFYCDGQLVPRGSQGRLPWSSIFNLQISYAPKSVKGLSVDLDILNIFDTRTVRAILEEEGQGRTTANTSYGEPSLGSVTAQRTVKLKVQYEF